MPANHASPGKSPTVVDHADPRTPHLVRSVRQSPQPDRSLLRRRFLTVIAGWTGGLSLACITVWLFQTGGTLCGALGMLSLQCGSASIILGYVWSDGEG